MKLSGVIITYNHDRFIEQTLRQALAQRVNFDYEIIVADDCSTDRTREIILDFCDRHPGRIVPILRDRNGGPVNLIEAMASCHGQYIALIDGDDYWVCEYKLQRQVDFLDQHRDYALCCHRVQVRDETGEGRDGIWPHPDFAAGTYTIEDLIAGNFIPTCSVMYRSECIGSLPDWFVDVSPRDWVRHILAARSGKIQLMDEAMAVYRMHSGGMWTSGRAIDQKHDMLRMMAALDRYMDFQYTDAIQRWRAVCFFDMAIIERLNGNRMATLKYLATSLRSGKLSLAGRWRSLAALLAFSLFTIKRKKPSPAEHA
jgi:glycosyltransferase involved in cell wall biosynthesis